MSARRPRAIAIRSTMPAMETAKQQVQELLSALPEDATLEDIQYHIYVRQKIEQGLADLEAGRSFASIAIRQFVRFSSAKVIV